MSWARLRFRGPEAQLVGVGILGEVDALWRPLGANEVDVDRDALDRLDDEQRSELDALTRDPFPLTEAAHPPVAADGTTSAVGVVGEAPPRSGAGSSRTVWAAYATALTESGIPVTVTNDMSRDDIVEAVDNAVEDHRAR